MEINWRALLTTLHGMLFGGFFVMATVGLVVELVQSIEHRMYSHEPLATLISCP